VISLLLPITIQALTPYSHYKGEAQCKVVRGGSWRDRSKRGTSSARLPYKEWQGVVTVGFRVIIE